MGTRTHPQRSARLRAWSLPVVLLALFTMGAQQVVAQTHWHAAQAQVDAGAQPAPQPGHSRDDSCLWCQVAAHASAAAPPAAAPRLVLVEEFLVRVLPVPQPVSRPQPAHAWQSRGPPTV
jgi:hypothetical protein